MSIRTSVSTYTIPVEYMWKCSACGAVNVSSQNLVAVGKGAYGSVDASRGEAWRKMNNGLGILSGKMGKYRSYRVLKLECSCKNCGHREIWATKSFYELHSLTLIKILVACWLLGPIILHKRTYVGFVLVSVAALGFVGAFLFDRIIITYSLNKKLETMPLSSFPVLVIDGEPVANKEFFQDNKPDEKRDSIPLNEKIAEKLTQTADILKASTANLEKAIAKDSLKKGERATETASVFCRKCGKQLPPDSAFCSYCGTKIVNK